MLDIYAKTQSTMIMDNIGFNDMILQKSSDGYNWSDELSLGTVVQSDLRYYTYSAQIKVDGGYFYRVTCKHYAEGTPYRSNVTLVQTAENTSKSFWMESDQGSHGAAETTVPATTYTTALPVTHTTAYPTTAAVTDLPEPPGTTAALTASAGTASASTTAKTASSSTAVSAGTTTSAVTSASTTAAKTAASTAAAKETGSPDTGASAPAAAAVTVIAAAAAARRTRRKK